MPIGVTMGFGMGLKVLLLEDDYALASELLGALVERSCEVVTVADAGQGLDAAASQRFDLILVSTELPGADGFELVDRIKSDPAAAHATVFVLSSTWSQEELAKKQQGGAKVDGFFTKPVAISELLASLPDRRSMPAKASLGPSVDLRETVKSLRADLSARSQVIGQLTAKNKELTERLTEVQSLLESERTERASAVASLEASKESHAVELQALEARRAEEAAERERAHNDETEFLERAQENASEAAARRLRDSEQMLAAERTTHAADTEARALELVELRELLASLARERDAALRERDEARTLVEANAMDVAQARMDLAEEERRRTSEVQAHTERIAALEKALGARGDADAERTVEHDRALARTKALEAELGEAKAKLADTARALDAAEREAAQQQLARDAAFHDMSVRGADELQAAVKAAKAEAAQEREELLRAHEAALVLVRDKAIAQTLAVARERKKQNRT